MEKVTEATVPDSKVEYKNSIHDLASAALTLQTVADSVNSDQGETLRLVSLLLKQAGEKWQDLETRLQQNEIMLREAQRIFQEFRELQTLVEILPVGILIAHDPQNQDMTINPAGLKMLNLPPGANPSKSAPDGEQLPFKVLRAGQEVPADELPMQAAIIKGVALHDIELDVQHTNGNLVNLLEYASPLYDEIGNVRGSLGVFVDITARKSVERRLFMQYHIAQILAESNNINHAAAQVMRMICETTGWEYGALWQTESNASLTNKGVWYTQDARPRLSEYAKAAQYSL